MTYYPASDLKYSLHKIIEYYLAHPDDPGPPRMIQEWKEVYEKGMMDYEDLDDDTVMTKNSRTSFFKRGG